MKAVVLADSLGYIDDDGVTQRVSKGAEVELSKADFERHLAHGMVAKPGSKESKPDTETAGYPGTHAELDALAEANSLEWPEGTKNVADKHAALEAAGVEPPTAAK